MIPVPEHPLCDRTPIKRPSTSTASIQHSAFDIRHSTFCIPSRAYLSRRLARSEARGGRPCFIRTGNLDRRLGGRSIMVRSEDGPEAWFPACRHEGGGVLFQSRTPRGAVVLGFAMR